MAQIRTQMTLMIKHQNDPALHTQLTQVIVTGIEGRELAFLGRLDADLQRAAKRCAAYLVEDAKESPDDDVLGALADAAFIAYGRLDEGAGGKFPKSILSQLKADQLDTHKWAMSIRDKFVGHSVNALNQAVAVADLVGTREEPTLLDTWVADFRVIPPDSDIERLKQLIVIVRDKLAVLMEDARTKLAKVISADLSAIVDNPPLQVGLVLDGTYDYRAKRTDLKGQFRVPGPR